MIPNHLTNTVYYSEWLEKNFNNEFNQLKFILFHCNIPLLPIKGTKDYWCRDYMPIQVDENRFVQFRYEPNYLKKDNFFRSNPKEICKKNGLNVQFSNINLDGGNIVHWSNKAILSDKIFKENPEYDNKSKLINDLENLLEVEIIIIPQIPYDPIGHIDAMLRFKDENTLLGNNRLQESKSWVIKLENILKEHNLNYIDIPFIEKPQNIKENEFGAIGLYVNYLEVGNNIILPLTGLEIDYDENNLYDEKIIGMFNELFPDRNIDYINYNNVAKQGGSLNCSTWNIYQKSNEDYKDKLYASVDWKDVYDMQITIEGLQKAAERNKKQPLGEITPISEDARGRIRKQNEI